MPASHEPEEPDASPGREAEGHPLDELKLVGIVTGIDPPKALFADARGIGLVVKPQDHVGRAGCRYRVEAIEAKAVTLEAVERSGCPSSEARRVVRLP